MKKTASPKTEQIANSEVMSVEEAITYHLEYNFAVPFPEEWIPEITDICIKGINAVNEYDLDRHIELPIGIFLTDMDGTTRQFAFAWEVIVKFRLDRWLNSEWQ